MNADLHISYHTGALFNFTEVNIEVSSSYYRIMSATQSDIIETLLVTYVLFAFFYGGGLNSRQNFMSLLIYAFTKCIYKH